MDKIEGIVLILRFCVATPGTVRLRLSLLLGISVRLKGYVRERKRGLGTNCFVLTHMRSQIKSQKQFTSFLPVEFAELKSIYKRSKMW